MGAREENIVLPPGRKRLDLTCNFSLTVWVFLTPLNVTYSRWVGAVWQKEGVTETMPKGSEVPKGGLGLPPSL